MKNKKRLSMFLTALGLLAVLMVIAFAVGLSWGSRSAVSYTHLFQDDDVWC